MMTKGKTIAVFGVLGLLGVFLLRRPVKAALPKPVPPFLAPHPQPQPVPPAPVIPTAYFTPNDRIVYPDGTYIQVTASHYDGTQWVYTVYQKNPDGKIPFSGLQVFESVLKDEITKGDGALTHQHG